LYFRKEEDGSTSYILIYVDDMLVAGKHASIIDDICRHLNQSFETNDLGSALHQKNKIEDILSTYNMKDGKPVTTPMEMSYLSSIREISDVLPNNTLYR
jgi:hypothetical protein